MSNYTKATNFTLKDGLSTGDPQKIIKGSEIDAEYNAIASAVASKADLNSPTFTGTPSAPTASTGTSSTQIASTAFVQSALIGAYPVGSIYMNAAVATNPSTLLGFGTWVAFGAGKVPVGIDTGDTDFDTIGETGGSKDAIIPSHTHTALVDDPGHNHTVTTSNTSTIASGNAIPLNYLYTTRTTSTNTTGITVTNSTEGESATGKNLQPYIVVYMWKRTA
jgi:hypothetical protein